MGRDSFDYEKFRVSQNSEFANLMARAANSLVMQRVASILKNLCPSLDEMLKARIAIDLDQCRRKKIN